MNTQFATNVHTFTSEVLDLLLEQFEGKTLGGEYDDSITKEDMMKSLFGDYKPGKVAKVKKGKKKKSSSDSKKKKALSGYTFFGAMNKEDINKEMKEIENDTNEKPKYVSIVGKKWKALSDEEKDEWNLTAKSYNLFMNENEGSDVSSWKGLSSTDKKSGRRRSRR
jgi:Chromatin-associated proteins containing the HMG domain